jgi:hypothetical protein
MNISSILFPRDGILGTKPFRDYLFYSRSCSLSQFPKVDKALEGYSLE